MALGLSILGTALAVVWSRHESRQLFFQLQLLEKESMDLRELWRQYQIERGTWAAHHHIERIARRQLHMHVPDEEMLVVVEPDD